MKHLITSHQTSTPERLPASIVQHDSGFGQAPAQLQNCSTMELTISEFVQLTAFAAWPGIGTG